MPDANHRHVDITEKGRYGSVIYRELGHSLAFYWEFGGGDAVAIIQAEDRPALLASWIGARRAGILRFVADEVIRQKAPHCRADIDEEAGCITLRQRTGNARIAGQEPARATGQALPAARRTADFVSQYSSVRSRFAVGMLVAGAVAGVLFWLKSRVLVVQAAAGTPIGLSVRTAEHVATLIETLEPYTPSLHRDASKDRYRVGVFIVPLEGPGPGRLVPIIGNQPAGAFQLAKFLGNDGRTLWFDAAGVGGVDLRTGERVHADERHPPIEARRPATLPLGPRPDTYFVAGRFTGPDAALGQLATSGRYLDAAFVRIDEKSGALRLGGPESVLMTYTSAPGLKGTLKVARVDLQGRLLWDVDTGIDRFHLAQVLPGLRSTVFIGTRPPIPDKLSEPILVVVDHERGALTTHSLWQ